MILLGSMSWVWVEIFCKHSHTFSLLSGKLMPTMMMHRKSVTFILASFVLSKQRVVDTKTYLLRTLSGLLMYLGLLVSWFYEFYTNDHFWIIGCCKHILLIFNLPLAKTRAHTTTSQSKL